MTEPTPDRYLSDEEVCAIVPGMTTDLLRQMRYRGDGPPYIAASPKKRVYKESSLRAWLDSREVTRTDELPAGVAPIRRKPRATDRPRKKVPA